MNNRNVKLFSRKYFHLRLFTRKLVIYKRTLAGLLARSMLNTFPDLLKKITSSRGRAFEHSIQWYEDPTPGGKLPPGTYSYGDSAGFAPDFPFNPPVRGEPKSLQRCEYPL